MCKECWSSDSIKESDLELGPTGWLTHFSQCFRELAGLHQLFTSVHSCVCILFDHKQMGVLWVRA